MVRIPRKKKRFYRLLTVVIVAIIVLLLIGICSQLIGLFMNFSASSSEAESNSTSTEVPSSSADIPASSVPILSGSSLENSSQAPVSSVPPVSSSAVVSSKPSVSSTPASSKLPVSSAGPSSKPPISSVSPPSSKPPVASQGGTSANTGIYTNVTWRSPYAVPANIFKHGRNLMLLNREYELPLDFKWDLVVWNTGKAVDAMSLNSDKYDWVRAVDRAAYQPLKDLFAAAKAAGVPLQLVSSYRSINLQDRLFDQLVVLNQKKGMSLQAAIDKANTQRTFTGTSEHNTGLGFDILEANNFYLSEAFEKTKQFKWLQKNAENYGFILRYAKDKVAQTGIMYEPWHYRYVGVEAAKEINALGMCLEEYIEWLDQKTN